MIIHPNELSTKFLENLFETYQSNLIDFKFESVGSGQVGDCYRIFLNWKMLNLLSIHVLSNLRQIKFLFLGNMLKLKTLTLRN